MTREQLEQQLAQMRQQESAISQQVDQLLEQLTMTRGAVQMLEHLLDIEDQGEAQVSPLSATEELEGSNHAAALS